MNRTFVPILADAIKAYYKDDNELIELCELINLDLNFRGGEIDLSHLKFASLLIAEIEYDNRRRFLESIVPSLLSRAHEGAANSEWDTQEFHRNMLRNIEKMALSLGEGQLPEEISSPEDKPFRAKSEVRELLNAAETTITIVDNYIGIGTLDCIREVNQTIRLLTGQHAMAIASGFDSGLRDLLSEGHQIEVRRHPRLHDRFILFNNRCWLVGSSLKDAGKKSFNMIECVDIKDSLIAEVERKWTYASKYDT